MLRTCLVGGAVLIYALEAELSGPRELRCERQGGGEAGLGL
jgi:hypothetical protein